MLTTLRNSPMTSSMMYLNVNIAKDFINDTEGAARAGAKKQAAFDASVEAVNAAVSSGDPDALLTALQTPATSLTDVNAECAMEYLALMMDKQCDSYGGRCVVISVFKFEFTGGLCPPGHCLCTFRGVRSQSC